MTAIGGVDGGAGQLPPTIHHMIQLGRLARGLSQEDLCKATGIPQGRLSRMENGLYPVSRDDLRCIAAELAFPDAFFLMNIQEHGTVSEVFHRKKVASGAKLVKSISAQLSIQSYRMAKLLDSVEVEPTRKMKALDPDVIGDDVGTIAREVRRAWGVAPGPILDLTSLIESAGVAVFRVDFGHNAVSGVSQWSESSMPIVVINTAVPTDRYRWTLAHELGHLFMHAGTLRPGKDIEGEADRFASEFLMPTSDISADLSGSLSLDRLAALKLHWRVSMSAIIRKALDVGSITNNHRTWLMIQMSRRGWRTNEPAPLPRESPRLASRILGAFLGIPGIGILESRDILGISMSDLKRWFQSEGDSGLKIVE